MLRAQLSICAENCRKPVLLSSAGGFQALRMPCRKKERAKGKLLPCERPCSAWQNMAYCKVKDKLPQVISFFHARRQPALLLAGCRMAEWAHWCLHRRNLLKTRMLSMPCRFIKSFAMSHYAAMLTYK